MSPFSYENFAQDNNFFGRVNEINKINTIVSTSNNILLFSKRRMGKSSLVKKVLQTQNDTICIYIDIFDSFTLPQKKAFKILTSQDGRYFTKEVSIEYNILKTSLGSAFKQLFKKELIDRAFELWGREILNRT